MALAANGDEGIYNAILNASGFHRTYW